MRTALIVVAISLMSGMCLGQSSTIHQNLVWYGLFTTLQCNDKWYVQNEFQERHFIDPLVQHQFLIRSHLHRVLGESGWEASLGMCLFLQEPQDPEMRNRLTVPELRPHVEFVYGHDLGRVTIEHRIRTEARFFHNTNDFGTALEEGYDFGNFRFRYRLQGTIPLIKVEEEKFLELKLSDEVHLKSRSSNAKYIFEQNRIYVGIRYAVLPAVKLEIGYLNWYQLRSSGDYYNRNIASIAVSHTVNLKRDKD